MPIKNTSPDKQVNVLLDIVGGNVYNIKVINYTSASSEFSSVPASSAAAS